MAVTFGRSSTAGETCTLRIGDPAPDFELKGHRNRETFRLRDLRRTRHVVLAFYPLDWTGV
jgi:peroxiredoxin